MPYHLTAITATAVVQAEDGSYVATLTATSDVVQLYVSGALAGWAEVSSGQAELLLPPVGDMDVLFFLGVDLEDASADYFEEAYPVAAAYGNRIKVQIQQAGYAVGDRWRVYLGPKGASSAATLVYEAEVYPGGRFTGVAGFGQGRFGQAACGYDANYLTYTSQPLTRGTWPVKITVVDMAGNESTASATSVTVNTYARPASDLSVTSYDKTTGELVLSWTASEDIT
jgi:hypothetical protein